MSENDLFVSVGDVSGDNAANRVLRKVKEENSNLNLFGLGGPRLKALGQEQLAAFSQISIIGFWEVAKRYFFFRSLFHRCLDEIKKRRPAAVLLVDYPGFNLRLAKEVHKLGIPVVYYISPQVWAWGRGRVADIKKYVDKMLVILPFEESYFREHGIDSEFVGHYLMEDIPEEYIQSSAQRDDLVAILPGSRRQEIERMLPSMLDAARLLYHKHRIMTSVAGIRSLYDYEKLLTVEDRGFISIVYDDTRKLLNECKAVICASGTATLETGIIGRPMVIAYRTGSLTYMIAKRLVKLEMIGLVNLVLGQRICPELIQQEMSGNRLAEEIEKLLTDSDYYNAQVNSLRAVPELLGGRGASDRVAERIGAYL